MPGLLMQWGVLPWLLCALPPPAAAARGVLEAARGQIARIEHSTPPSDGSAEVSVSKQVALCDCEKATGTPDGLSCEKEGYFISNFERVGSWLSGGGHVPLSAAVCCRPCLPELLTPDKAVAVVSLGCHTATGPGPTSLACEADGRSLVAGWTQAVQVSTTVDAYYPVGAAACCTPGALLASGDAVELERCECALADDISCGGTGTHRLLYGFPTFRGPVQSASSLAYVPVGPALCCRVCLTDRTHSMSDCADLNFCSGRGVCLLGACDCLAGYGGADCSRSEDPGGAQRLPQWLLSVIIVANFGLFSLCIVFVQRILHLCRQRQQLAEEEAAGSEPGEGPLREPLLGMDDGEGSVGSADTTDCESDAEHPHVPEDGLEGPQGEGALQPGLRGAQDPPAAPEQGPEPTAEGEGPLAERGEAGLGERWRRRRQRHARGQAAAPAAGGGELVEPAPPEIETAREQHQSPQRGRRPKGEEGPEGAGAGAKGRVHSGVQGIDCSVCMIRTVQVALIPCGHTCLCRRCSRRLLRCPICRRDIARRQRLYVGG